MMDLEEARVSLGFYADLLDSHCSQYRLAIILAEKGKNAGPLESRAIGLIDQATAELRRLQREALGLGILIDEAIAKEAQQFVRLPLELSKLLEARSRIAVSLQQAGDLLQEHDRKEAEKNAPPKESDVVVAIRAFREKWKKEESERIEPTSNGRSEES
jgi:hypothetical protein